jgi:hypothetical protein
MKNITGIEFPNTISGEQTSYYKVGSTCDEIKYFEKSGEMAMIGWFKVIKKGEVIAEIKESVCNIYGADKI